MSQKNILLIGASSGIGHDLAIKLLDQNHTVFCASRRLEKMRNLEVLGAKIFSVDVTDEEQVNRLVENMIEQVGHIDIVYANAGFAIAGPVEETSIEKVHSQFDTNVYGAARIARAVLPYMREKEQGRIIFTTSIAGRVSTSMNAWYSASKHALNGMVKALAQEVQGFGIHVSTIEPGCVQTEFDSIQLADMKTTTELEAYDSIVKKSHHFLQNAYNSGSTPESTVNNMLKAGFDNKPKLSYQTTLDSKLMFWVQKLIGEQTFGRLILKIIQRNPA
ncbi:SDR family oxidoreductase [Vibrio sp. ZSDE26]|uniref:SDR family oxidoreductase n=1 Tax=Vibrio amylolyticus TaxID=2847292 RepID=A0A9X2BHW8_9VIBR|nr:SDR family oxidoreductase [Vibrio amylolyticus]MCK6263465.1 SDR family oxidoreductase [Vibrio amylolyticus]